MKVPSILRLLRPLLLGCLAVVIFTGCRVGYIVDKKSNQVIWQTWDEGRGTVTLVITNADVATFEVLKLGGPSNFARDKNRVYLEGEPVSGAHPESFRKLDIHGGLKVPGGGNVYYRDSERIFVYPYSIGGIIGMLADSDPDSFKVITNGWSRDRTRVYLYDKGFVPKDIDSFEPLERLWSRDSKTYYFGTHELTDADRNSFHISEEQPNFATDHDHVFWYGWVIEGCRPETFHITSANSGFDDRFTYQFEEVWEAGVDVDFRKIKVQKQPLK